MIVPLLLLMAATVHTGSVRRTEAECGGRYRIILMSGIETIKFTPDSDGKPVLLLSQRNQQINTEVRGKVSGIYFVISNLLKRDSGTYTVRDRSGDLMWVERLVVEEISQSITVAKHKELSFSFQLEAQHCNIFYYPAVGYGMERAVVLKGDKLEDQSDCQWWYVMEPCGIGKDHMNNDCAGHYEIRDDRDEIFATVQVDVEDDEEPAYLSHIGTGLGIFFLLAGCCGCLKHCCCGKKSKKQNTDDTNADDVPTTEAHRQYDTEPATRRPVEVHQPTQPETHYPPQPSYAPTGPQTYNPTVHIPPAYSQVTAPEAPVDPPPHYTEVDPRFELTGFAFASAPPLSSNTTDSDVYTSEKLNFL